MALILDGTTGSTGTGAVVLGTSPTITGATITVAATAAPAFSAYSASNQNPSSGVWTKVVFGTESFDTNNNFASSTFTPTVAGYYQISASVAMGADTLATACGITIYKNGSANLANIGTFFAGQNTTSYLNPSTSGLIYMNGTTDYLEVYARVDGTGVLRYFFLSQGNFPTVFTGALVRSA